MDPRDAITKHTTKSGVKAVGRFYSSKGKKPVGATVRCGTNDPQLGRRVMGTGIITRNKNIPAAYGVRVRTVDHEEDVNRNIDREDQVHPGDILYLDEEEVR